MSSTINQKFCQSYCRQDMAFVGVKRYGMRKIIRSESENIELSYIQT